MRAWWSRVIDRVLGINPDRRAWTDHSRPPTPAECSAHRLGITVGLMEAEGILSDIGAAIDAREKVNPDARYLTAEREVVRLARCRVLARRIQHQGEWERSYL